MEKSKAEISTIATKIKKLAIVDYIIIVSNYISFILIFFLFINVNSIGMILGFVLQFVVLLIVLFIIKYFVDKKICKLHEQIADKFEDRNTNLFLTSSQSYSLRDVWLNFNGKFWYWIFFFSVRDIFNAWKLNNYIYDGAQELIE